MTELELVPYEEVISFVGPKAKAQALRDGSSTGWKVTKKKGGISGVGAESSGQGAWVYMEGDMYFTLKQMEKSATYNVSFTNH